MQKRGILYSPHTHCDSDSSSRSDPVQGSNLQFTNLVGTQAGRQSIGPSSTQLKFERHAAQVKVDLISRLLACCALLCSRLRILNLQLALTSSPVLPSRSSECLVAAVVMAVAVAKAKVVSDSGRLYLNLSRADLTPATLSRPVCLQATTVPALFATMGLCARKLVMLAWQTRAYGIPMQPQPRTCCKLFTLYIVHSERFVCLFVQAQTQ